MTLSSNFIETTVVDAKSNRTVFLFGKNDRRLRRLNETFGKVFIDEVLDNLQFGFELFVDRSIWWNSSGFEFDSVVIRSVWREDVSVDARKDISKICIDFGDVRRKWLRGIGVVI